MILIKKNKEVPPIDIKLKTIKGKIKTVEIRSFLTEYNGLPAVQAIFRDQSIQKQLLTEQIRVQVAEELNKLLQNEIDERKLTEEKMFTQTAKMHAIIENSDHIIWIVDKKGSLKIFNKNFENYFYKHYKTKIKKGFTILDKKYISSNEYNNFWKEKISLAYEGKPQHFESKLVNHNGTTWLEMFLNPIYDSSGKPYEVSGIGHDITEKKKSEELIVQSLHEKEKLLKEVHEQSSKLNAIIESSDHIIWTTDKDSKLKSYNKNFKNYFEKNYLLQAKIGLPLNKGESISTEIQNDYWNEKNAATFAGKPQHFETKLINKKGAVVWLEVYLNPITDDNGNTIELAGIGYDITEKKSGEELITQSLHEKEILLKEVHHRVKNNLQLVSSILNLQSSYVKDEKIVNVLKDSQNRIKSMSFIHESLYQTKNFTSINFSQYVTELSKNLIHSYADYDGDIKLGCMTNLQV